MIIRNELHEKQTAHSIHSNPILNRLETKGKVELASTQWLAISKTKIIAMYTNIHTHIFTVVNWSFVFFGDVFGRQSTQKEIY